MSRFQLIVGLSAALCVVVLAGSANAYGVTTTSYTHVGYGGTTSHSNTGKGPYSAETGGHVGTSGSSGSYYGSSAHSDTGKGPYSAETGGHVGNNGSGGRTYSPTVHASYSTAGRTEVNTVGVYRR